MSQCWPIGGMSPAQKAVLISLADQANDDGYCWPSASTIAKRTCLSERAVRSAILWLRETGFLRSSERSGTSSVYQITPEKGVLPLQQMHPCSKCTPADAAPRGADAAGVPLQMPHPTPADAAPKPSLNRQLNRKEPKSAGDAAPGFQLPDWIDQKHWDVWHSCKKRKGVSDGQKQMAVDQLADWRREGVDHAAALKSAALAGWQGLFKPDVQAAGRRDAPGETAYQKSMRLRVAEAAPGLARKDPSAASPAGNFLDVIEVQARTVGSLP
jgi:hypothetical protein